MNAARAYRRLKEVEQKKLENRLMLLKLELEKAEKKISETQERTSKISQHRSRIEERHIEKQKDYENRMRERALKQEINATARERIAAIRRASMLGVYQEKVEGAKEVKEISERNELIIGKQRELELKRAIEVKRLIREQRLQGVANRNEEVERKRDEAKQEFEKRLREEAEKSAKCEAQVSELERLELELINQLERAQDAQRSAYKELEDALLQSKKTILTSSRQHLQQAQIESGVVQNGKKKKSKRSNSARA